MFRNPLFETFRLASGEGGKSSGVLITKGISSDSNLPPYTLPQSR